MKQLITIFICVMVASSCTVFKPKPTPTPTQEKVPNIMSRSIPELPDVSVPDRLALKIMRDSILKITRKLDTMLYDNRLIMYNTNNTVRYQNKVIDTLWKWKQDSKIIIDSLKVELDKFKTTYFNPDHFEVSNGVMDSVSLIITKPLPQPMNRQTISNSVSPSWLSWHSINPND